MRVNIVDERIFPAIIALSRKECSRFFRIWKQTLLPSVITSILYFLIFGKVIGDYISGWGGVSYIQFIAPGLIMLAVITNSYTNSVSSFFGMRMSKQIEEILVTGLPAWAIILGFISGSALRGIISGILVTIVAFIFAGFQVQHFGLFLIDLVITALLFSLAGLVNGIFANNFDDVGSFSTFILTPLIYLGGVFYNVSQLGSFWRGLSSFNPIYYIIHFFRYSVLGIGSHDLFSFGILLLLIFCVYSYVYFLISRGYKIKV
jgi:ABC-2 type transport system permease protein